MPHNSVMISYRRLHKDFVRQLDTALKNNGYEVWIDWEDIRPGEKDYVEAIEAGIEQSNVFLAVLSPEYLASPHCTNELNHAVRHSKKIIPVIYADVDPKTVPDSISHINWVYFNKEDDFETAFGKLSAAIDMDQAHVDGHTRLLVAARRWQGKGREDSFVLRGRDLTEAEAWLKQSAGKQPEPSRLHREFIASSQRARRGRRSIQLLTVTSTLASLIAIVLLITLRLSYQEVNEQRDLAEKNAARASRLSLAAAAPLAEREAPGAGLALALAANSSLTGQETPPAEVQEMLANLAYAPGLRHRLEGHSGAVWDVKYSPDGMLAVSVGANGEIRLWDAVTGAQLKVMTAPTHVLYSVAWSPDGQSVLVGGTAAYLARWDVTTGTEAQVYTGAVGTIGAVAFSADGTTFFSGSGGNIGIEQPGEEVEDNQLIIWEAVTGTPRHVIPHAGRILSMQVVADGILTGSGDQERLIRLWDIETGALKRNFGQQPGWVRTMALSHDGQTLATTAWTLREGGVIYLWNVRNGRLITRILGHQDVVTRLRFTPDGRYLISASWDRHLITWDLFSYSRLLDFVHENLILGLDISPDGQHLLSSTGHYNSPNNVSLVQQWDMTSGAIRQEMHAHADWVQDVAYSPNGQYIAGALGPFDMQEELNNIDRDVRNVPVDTGIYLWEAATGQRWRRLDGHRMTVNTLAFSPDSRWLASGADDQLVRLWDMTGEEVSKVLRGHTGRVNAVVFTLDGLISGGEDGTLRYWNLDGTLRTTLEAHHSPVNALAVSFDGRYLLSVSGHPADMTGENLIILWDLQTLTEVRRFAEEHTAAITSVAFSLDGQQAVTGGWDRRVILWEVATGQMIRTLRGHTGPVLDVDFVPGRAIVVSVSTDSSLRFWYATNGRQFRNIDNPSPLSATRRTGNRLLVDGHASWIISVVVSPDGSALLTGAEDSTVREWRLDTLPDLITWTEENRYLRPIACEVRQQYGFGC